MEACDATLQELIAAELLTSSEVAWAFLDQILDGLAYVHDHGIIHRDLKPANLFLSFEALGGKVTSINDLATISPSKMRLLKVKLGDFGLAKDAGLTRMKKSTQTWESYIAESRGLNTSNDSILNTTLTADGDENAVANLSNVAAGFVMEDDDDNTTDIGTTLYMPPDLNGQWSIKTDLYSLGVTFFEMLHPFHTGMERVVVLRKLRSRTMQVCGRGWVDISSFI